MMQGLTQQEAKNRLRQDGKNELAEAPKSKPVRMFLGQFRDVMVMILLAATMVSVLLGEWTDAITIILIVLLNAILGFIQEFRTERTLETLRQMTAPTAAVCRDGTWQTISAAELVRGDLIRLEAGDRVPADAALVTASGIAANESILTGESAAEQKPTRTTPSTRKMSSMRELPSCEALPLPASLQRAQKRKWDRFPTCCTMSQFLKRRCKNVLPDWEKSSHCSALSCVFWSFSQGFSEENRFLIC